MKRTAAYRLGPWAGAALIASVATTATASSSKAWERGEDLAIATCLDRAREELRSPVLIAAPTDFARQTLVYLAGRHRAPHMRGERLTYACLFDKRRVGAEVVETRRDMTP